MTRSIDQARKLENVRYDIRGRILDKTEELEEQGHKILRLNVGNPAPFGFEAPDEIMMAMIRNLPTAQGYSDSRGLFSARTAVVQYYQTKGLSDLDVGDVYLGNGVSELITMTMQALCNPEDEVLIPSPTTRCGRVRLLSPEALRSTTWQTRLRTGLRTSRIWNRRSPPVPGPSS